MDYPSVVTVQSEEETIGLAEKFSESLIDGEVVVLNGNLGSGKTFFIKHVLKNYNIKNVNSPTFSIVNEYYGQKKIYHFDFYRIEKINELLDIGFYDYINDREAVTFIEWGNLFNDILPQKRIEVSIDVRENESREFRFNKYE